MYVECTNGLINLNQITTLTYLPLITGKEPEKHQKYLIKLDHHRIALDTKLALYQAYDAICEGLLNNAKLVSLENSKILTP